MQYKSLISIIIITMHYDLSMPMDKVFNAIGELGDLAEAGGSLISSEQMMDLAYLILSKVPMLQQELLRWHRRPIVAKTWPNMLIHFRATISNLNILEGSFCFVHISGQSYKFCVPVRT
jgi:hypothetical protein